jgi:hypothetical protein
LLESAGIWAEIRNEQLFGARGELPVSPEDMPSVWIRDSDASRALQILEEADTEATHSDPAWMCSQCGETLEPQFTTCWNCGADRPTKEGES